MYINYLGCENLDENKKIWRYLKFDFFEFLLKEKKLWFSQVDKFDDEFEGWSPETDEKRHNLFQKYKSHTYANCWHMKKHVSNLMWEVYGNDRKYLFSWDGIPGNDNLRLIEFLTQNFGIDWAKIAKIKKIDNGKTIKVSTKKKAILLKLNDELTEVNLEIENRRTDIFVVEKNLSKLDLYKNNKGIAIQSTLKRLRQSFDEEQKLEQYIPEVQYVDFDKIETIDEYRNIILPFCRKSKEYDDEQEIRALTIIIDPNKWPLYNNKILIPVRLDVLIEKIYLHPNSSENDIKSVQGNVKRYGLKIPVILPRKKPRKPESDAVPTIIANLGSDPSGNTFEDYVIGQNEH